MSRGSWLAFGALCVIWGVPYFFIRIAVHDVPPLVVAWGRITLAALILLPIAWRRGALTAVRPHLGAVCAFACVEFVVPFSAICIGERWIGSAIAGILIAGVPLTIALMSRFAGVHEPLGPRRLFGLVIGFLGVAGLVGLGPVSGLHGWIGAACMLLATLGYAAGPLVIQRHLSQLQPIGPVTVSLVIASLVLLLPALLTFPARVPPLVDIGSIIVLGVLCTAIAMLLMFSLVSAAGAARASVIPLWRHCWARESCMNTLALWRWSPSSSFWPVHGWRPGASGPSRCPRRSRPDPHVVVSYCSIWISKFNTLSGNARRDFGHRFNISVPAVVHGRRSTVDYPADTRPIVIPIAWRTYHARLVVCLN